VRIKLITYIRPSENSHTVDVRYFVPNPQQLPRNRVVSESSDSGCINKFFVVHVYDKYAQNEPEHDIHKRTRHNHNRPLPNGFIPERPPVVFFVLVVFTKLAGTAERHCFQLIDSFFSALFEQRGTHAEVKGINAHFEKPSSSEMPDFMD
jgi:hypothetical protein